MNGFISYAAQLERHIRYIVSCPDLHVRWLNTLSYLENCGARKIAASEHPTLVKEEVLKHASEEFRHAHYLKKQITRVSGTTIENYTMENMLGGVATLNYLNALNLHVCKHLTKSDVVGRGLKEAAYLLVTYAIELRASELYPIYESSLRAAGSRVAVRSILLEEEGHLEEMVRGLQKLPDGYQHARKACEIEGILCQRWLSSLPMSS